MAWFDFKDFAQNPGLITDCGEELSYAALDELCLKLGATLKPRSLVFCLVSNNIPSVAIYLSCLKHHCVPLLLASATPKTLLDTLIGIYHPNYLWGASGEISSYSGPTVSECQGFSLKHIADKQVQLHPDLALLISTSGSTGSPKLVRQSYRNLESNTASISSYLKLSKAERPITVLPMNYVFGLSVLNTHLSCGATVLLTDKSIMQRKFWDFMAKGRATSFSGVPYTYEMLNKLMFFRRKLPDLKTMTQAGGRLGEDLHRKFAEYAAAQELDFVVMYGAAEATSRMSWLDPKVSLKKCGSIGKAIPGGSFTLVDSEGQRIDSCNTEGELVYSGDNVCMGYAQGVADLARGDDNHGVLHTGDLAYRDEEGFYYISGRLKRFLKIYGNRVGLDECEQLIKTQFPDYDFACVGQDDALEIVYVGDKSPKEQDFIQYLAEKTGLNQKAFSCRAVAAFPRNSSGKILYQKL